jgi:hypothetical protein
MHLLQAFGYSCFSVVASAIAIRDFALFEEFGAPAGWEPVATPSLRSRINFSIALHAVCPIRLKTEMNG